MMEPSAYLMSRLGEAMNDTHYAWVAYGPFDVDHIVGRLLAEVAPLADSVVGPDGFAVASSGRCEWVMVDAALGSAAFIIPSGLSVEEVRDPLLALGGGIKVSAGIYGSVDDDVWLTLGGAGQRQVIPAEHFIP